MDGTACGNSSLPKTQRACAERYMHLLTKLIVRPTPQTSRLIRSREASLYLAISVKALRRLVRLGHIPVIQSNGGPWLFDTHRLDEYIERQQAAQYPTGTGSNGFERGEHA